MISSNSIQSLKSRLRNHRGPVIRVKNRCSYRFIPSGLSVLLMYGCILSTYANRFYQRQDGTPRVLENNIFTLETVVVTKNITTPVLEQTEDITVLTPTGLANFTLITNDDRNVTNFFDDDTTKVPDTNNDTSEDSPNQVPLPPFSIILNLGGESGSTSVSEVADDLNRVLTNYLMSKLTNNADSGSYPITAISLQVSPVLSRRSLIKLNHLRRRELNAQSSNAMSFGVTGNATVPSNATVSTQVISSSVEDALSDGTSLLSFIESNATTAGLKSVSGVSTDVNGQSWTFSPIQNQPNSPNMKVSPSKIGGFALVALAGVSLFVWAIVLSNKVRKRQLEKTIRPYREKSIKKTHAPSSWIPWRKGSNDSNATFDTTLGTEMSASPKRDDLFVQDEDEDYFGTELVKAVRSDRRSWTQMEKIREDNLPMSNIIVTQSSVPPPPPPRNVLNHDSYDTIEDTLPEMDHLSPIRPATDVESPSTPKKEIQFRKSPPQNENVIMTSDSDLSALELLTFVPVNEFVASPHHKRTLTDNSDGSQYSDSKLLLLGGCTGGCVSPITENEERPITLDEVRLHHIRMFQGKTKSTRQVSSSHSSGRVQSDNESSGPGSPWFHRKTSSNGQFPSSPSSGRAHSDNESSHVGSPWFQRKNISLGQFPSSPSAGRVQSNNASSNHRSPISRNKERKSHKKSSNFTVPHNNLSNKEYEKTSHNRCSKQINSPGRDYDDKASLSPDGPSIGRVFRTDDLSSNDQSSHDDSSTAESSVLSNHVMDVSDDMDNSREVLQNRYKDYPGSPQGMRSLLLAEDDEGSSEDDSGASCYFKNGLAPSSPAPGRSLRIEEDGSFPRK